MLKAKLYTIWGVFFGHKTKAKGQKYDSMNQVILWQLPCDKLFL